MNTNVKNIDEFRDKAIYGNNKADLLEEVKQNNHSAKKSKKYQIVTMTNEDWFKITQTGRTFLSEPFSNSIQGKYKIYVCEKFYYIYVEGFYKFITRQALKSIIEKELRKFNYIDIKTNWSNEVIERIESNRYISLDKFEKIFNQDKTVINIKNGIVKIDFKTGNYEFLKHNMKYRTTIQLDVLYSPLETDLKNWNNFINTSLNTEKERMFLQEIMGYCFINHLNNNGQNIYCLHGEGGNGKGTTRRILNSILGIKNFIDCKSKLLTDSESQNQFFGFQFKDKLLIGTNETNYNFKDMSLLKLLSGGDRQSNEMKGTNETIDYDFKGKIILSTNDKVKIYDTSKGTKRRLKFLLMDNEIKNIISDLDERLLSEKNAIFVWCLEGLSRLIKNNFRHTLPDSHFEIFDKYMEHSNNYLKFIRKHIKIGEGIIKSEIVQLFNEQYGNIYRDKENLYEAFEKELKSEGINFEIRNKRIKSIFTGDVRNTICYIGISYIEHKLENDLNFGNIKEKMIEGIDINKKHIIEYLKTPIADEELIEIKKVIEYVENQRRFNRAETVTKIINEKVKKNLDDDKKYEFIFDVSKINLNMNYPTKTVCKLYLENNILVSPECKEIENTNMIKNFYKELNIKPGMTFDEVDKIINSGNKKESSTDSKL